MLSNRNDNNDSLPNSQNHTRSEAIDTNMTFGSFLGLLQTSVIEASNTSNQTFVDSFLSNNFEQRHQSDFVIKEEANQLDLKIDTTEKVAAEINADKDADKDADNDEAEKKEAEGRNVYEPKKKNFIIQTASKDTHEIISIPTLVMGRHNHVKLQDIEIQTGGQLVQERDLPTLQFKRVDVTDVNSSETITSSSSTSRSGTSTVGTTDRISIKMSTTDPPEMISRLMDQLNDTVI